MQEAQLLCRRRREGRKDGGKEEEGREGGEKVIILGVVERTDFAYFTLLLTVNFTQNPHMDG